MVPIPHLLADVLREYLDEVRPRLPASPYLFANPRGNRRLRGPLRASGATRSRVGGRDVGGHRRSALCSPLAS